MFESLATKYLEAASTKLPLRYFFLFALGFLIIAADEGGQVGVIDSLLSLKLVDLMSEKYWVKQAPSLGWALFACVFVITGAWVEKAISSGLLRLNERNNKYKESVRKIYESARLHLPPRAERQSEIALIEAALMPSMKRINLRTSLAQTSGALGVFLILLPWGSVLDMVVGVVLLIVALLAVIRSMQIFIADYFPLAVMRNILQGRREIGDVDT
ncbi:MULTISPECIES: hypothetical protein [unclassified Lysobacter]|uniref:hypothetical protein n=1 Tax=unclassified Lysobacter TaxID=2635362 RepID=UPI001BE7779E|nr:MULTISPECIES: hypothetical protein [unclassified Lysobacter]MBT2746062.1 hypothetical protein [Lysobacter sp. ISL-42]MBT2752497.1 hypothetical protein [Lysobacter sp. ISL-50]MBT2776774.1 hypothetical protein [Lysobacter sp. ISL-54]MBT2780658.1 hypothetical protein [Lysobacter sp. ISL-52]